MNNPGIETLERKVTTWNVTNLKKQPKESGLRHHETRPKLDLSQVQMPCVESYPDLQPTVIDDSWLAKENTAVNIKLTNLIKCSTNLHMLAYLLIIQS